MTIEIADVEPNPWNRFNWTGDLRSDDGTATVDFTRADVAEIIAWYSIGDRWDGNTAGVARLNDGRFIAWEAEYGPTGDGFCCDAYGGTSDVFFAATADAALSSIGEVARDTLRGMM